MYSLIVPVYRNEASLPELLDAIEGIAARLDGSLQAVFIVDGSPDRSHEVLERALPGRRFASVLLLLSRNFGSFAAIRVGLAHATGAHVAIMAADLQEPPELVLEFFRRLATGAVDVVVGTRRRREDPLPSRVASRLFWGLYRRFIVREIPSGGVDAFGCTAEVRDRLLEFREANTSLVGQLFWLGYRREAVPYDRRLRRHGRSAWTVRRKLRYLTDSIFSFSDLPVRLLVSFGLLGVLLSVAFSAVVLVARLSGLIPVPGYAATVLLISFFAGLNSLGLGIIGSYVWRAFENTKARPTGIVRCRADYAGRSEDGPPGSSERHL